MASGRVVDVLVGPAGTGKTTTMAAVRAVWETRFGAGSVIGLAPSAAAAAVLAEDLGIGTENTVKWLYDHQAGQASLRPGQLVIVDEASLAGTRTLHDLANAVAVAGGKLLLVGDPAQLGAVDAGGAFGLLAAREGVATLTDPRRFAQPWEADATLGLRAGKEAVLDTYAKHGRVLDGGAEAMLDAAYSAWTDDLAAGRESLLIAADRATVTKLNLRARTDRIRRSQVDPSDEVLLADDTHAGTGDVVVTRRNDRKLHTGRGWVRNGDRWQVTATHPDGSLTVTHPGDGRRVVLPAGYVAAHVELGYASTVHRAQGATVDTAHAIVTPAMTRETLYVAMTRARNVNTAHVTTDQPDDEAHQAGGDEPDAATVLKHILRRTGAEQSATRTIADEQNRLGGIGQLAAEYDTIAAAAQHNRWATLIRTLGLTPDEADRVVGSDAFGPLCAALRRADANGHVAERLLPQILASRPLDDADDLAAVLRHRLDTATRTRRPQGAPRLIAGLIPAATGPMPPELRTALDERADLIETRAMTLAQNATAQRADWTRILGPAPTDHQQRDRWTRQVQAIAAYRDRYKITGPGPLGSEPSSAAQRRDAIHARAALHTAQQFAHAAGRATSVRSSGRDIIGPTR